METLKHTFMYDLLFKILFVKHPHLLKRLVSALLGIKSEGIGQFDIKNPELTPGILGAKFCRLDIHMVIDWIPS